MKLWGGRFSKTTDELVEHFHSSITFDKRLYRQDIIGSMAHAQMLGEQGIIATDEAKQIIENLAEILADIEAGKVEFSLQAEDIHMNIEVLLTEKIGDIGKKLHTARSRNDQVALDLRMYLKDEIASLLHYLIELNTTLLDLAKKHLDTVMPGYTHLQKAQPVTLAHHFNAYVQMFGRDMERLQDCYKRVDVLPLGSGALAGTTFPIKRERVAELLGFAEVSKNSMDGVSDRDFAVEFSFCNALIMTHLSRFCEELILWSSNEFAFIEIDDAYATGSSIMPQKKNPDVAELVRGKTGRVYGDVMTLLTMLKGLPLAYNKDMQEDKEAVFDALDTVKGALSVFTPMLATLKINSAKMAQGAAGGFTNATEVADYLATKGIPFREAHAIVGKIVAYCIAQGKDLFGLTPEEWKTFSPLFANDISDYIDIKNAVSRRKLVGGPGKEAALETINAGGVEVTKIQQWLVKNPKKISILGRNF